MHVDVHNCLLNGTNLFEPLIFWRGLKGVMLNYCEMVSRLMKV